jgi:uncharacterized membrane protein SirB2
LAFALAIGLTLSIGLILMTLRFELQARRARRARAGFVVIAPRVDDPVAPDWWDNAA